MKRTTPSQKAILAAVGAAQPPSFWMVGERLADTYDFDIRYLKTALFRLCGKGQISIAVEGRVLAFRLVGEK